jgi:hypothetical protein
MDHRHQGFLNRGQSVGIGHSQVSPRSQYCDSDEINSDGGERSTRGGEGVVETEKRSPASFNFCRRFPVEVTQTPCMTHDAGGVHRRNRMLALGRDTAARSHTIRRASLATRPSCARRLRRPMSPEPRGRAAGRQLRSGRAWSHRNRHAHDVDPALLLRSGESVPTAAE